MTLSNRVPYGPGMDLTITSATPGGPHYVVDGVTYELPTSFTAVATGVPDLPYEVEVTVRMDRDGPHAERVELRQLYEGTRPVGPYVTGTALRRLALGDLVARATEQAVSVATRVERSARRVSATLEAPTGDQRATFGRHYRRTGGRSNERHTAVAEVYREALVRGVSPTSAVADAFDVARSTAGRYVQQAREAGALGPAPGPRQAGEVSLDEQKDQR